MIYGLTNDDVRLLKDMIRRQTGGRGTQQPRRKQRRYPTGRGGGGSSAEVIGIGLCVAKVPAAKPYTVDSGKFEPGIGLGAIARMAWDESGTNNLGTLKRAESVESSDANVADALNLTMTPYDPGASGAILVSGYFITLELGDVIQIDPPNGKRKQDFFVIASDKDFRSFQDYAKGANQIPYHKLGEDEFRLGGKECE